MAFGVEYVSSSIWLPVFDRNEIVVLQDITRSSEALHQFDLPRVWVWMRWQRFRSTSELPWPWDSLIHLSATLTPLAVLGASGSFTLLGTFPALCPCHTITHG